MYKETGMIHYVTRVTLISVYETEMFNSVEMGVVIVDFIILFK